MQQGSDILTWIQKPYVPISHGLFFPTDWVLHLWGNTPMAHGEWAPHEHDDGLGLGVGSPGPLLQTAVPTPAGILDILDVGPRLFSEHAKTEKLEREGGWEGALCPNNTVCNAENCL